MAENGVVKFFNAGRGYGFIAPESGGKDIFLHVTSLKQSNVVGPLNEGDKLQFEITEGPKGPSATQIVRLK